MELFTEANLSLLYDCVEISGKLIVKLPFVLFESPAVESLVSTDSLCDINSFGSLTQTFKGDRSDHA